MFFRSDCKKTHPNLHLLMKFSILTIQIAIINGFLSFSFINGRFQLRVKFIVLRCIFYTLWIISGVLVVILKLEFMKLIYASFWNLLYFTFLWLQEISLNFRKILISRVKGGENSEARDQWMLSCASLLPKCFM